jgi:S-adenosylmethionine decarboxylase
MNSYGKHLILDLFECDITVNDRPHLANFFIGITDRIGMERAVDPITGKNLAMYWTEGDPNLPAHLIGTSGVQFIRTSNIIVHTLTELETVYIDIFSCKDFSSQDAVRYCKAFFGGKIQNSIVLERG